MCVFPYRPCQNSYRNTVYVNIHSVKPSLSTRLMSPYMPTTALSNSKTCLRFLIVRGQVCVRSLVYKHYVGLYENVSSIVYIIQYTDK